MKEIVFYTNDKKNSLKKTIMGNYLVDFCGDNLCNFDFSMREIYGWQFINTTLQNSSFQKSYVYWSSFELGDLSFADLSQATFCGCYFADAVFYNANLRGTKFLKDSLGGCNDFSNCDLTNILFDRTTLWEGTCYNSRTKFPDNFSPIDYGMTFSEE